MAENDLPTGEPPALPARSEANSVTTRSAATIFGLSGVPLPEVEALLLNVRARRDRVESEFIKRKGDVALQLKLLENDIERCESDLARIEQDRQSKLALDRYRIQLESEMGAVELQIRLQRLRAERTAIDEALEDLEREREDAQREILSHDHPAAEQRRRIWHEQKSLIDARVTRLGTERDALYTRLQDAEARVAALNDRYVTRTVAGFLLWAGYGTLAATGAVLGHLFGDGDGLASAGTLFVGSAQDALIGMQNRGIPAALGLVLLVGILILTLWLILKVFKRFDSEVTTFDDNWTRARATDITFTLPNPDIRRSSYTQLLAALPFVFLIGVGICFLAIRSNRTGVPTFESIISSVTDTFIGTSVGLICTSIMILYALRAIEPRRGFPPKDLSRESWRQAWEFYALPIALLLTIILAAVLTSAKAPVAGSGSSPEPRWIVFGAFMLLSTVTLAYGVVFHGVFKDALKLTASVRKYDETIERLAFGPDAFGPDPETLNEYRRVTRDYRLRKERLQALEASRKVGEALGHELFDSEEQRELDAYLEAQKKVRLGLLQRFRRQKTPPRAPEFHLKALDLRESHVLSERHSRLAAMREENEMSTKKLEERIAQKLQIASDPRLHELRGQHASFERDMQEVEGERLNAIAALEEELASQRMMIRRDYELGVAARPSFEAVRNADTPPLDNNTSGGQGGSDGPVH